MPRSRASLRALRRAGRPTSATRRAGSRSAPRPPPLRSRTRARSGRTGVRTRLRDQRPAPGRGAGAAQAKRWEGSGGHLAAGLSAAHPACKAAKAARRAGAACALLIRTANDGILVVPNKIRSGETSTSSPSPAKHERTIDERDRNCIHSARWRSSALRPDSAAAPAQAVHPEPDPLPDRHRILYGERQEFHPLPLRRVQQGELSGRDVRRGAGAAALRHQPQCRRAAWVDFFDQAGHRLYGFCALGSPNDLG